MVPRLLIFDKFELHVYLSLKILLPDPALILVFILVLNLPGTSGVVTTFFNNILVPAAEEVGLIQDDVQSVPIPTEPSTSKPTRNKNQRNSNLKHLKFPLLNLHLNIGYLHLLMIHSLMVRGGEHGLKDLYSVHSKVDTTAPVEEKEKSFKQERIIAGLDEDVEINLEEAQPKPYRMDLEHQEKVFSIQDANDKEPAKVEEVLEVVKAAKWMTEVVTTTGAPTTAEATKVNVPKRRRGVVIQDPEETTSIVIVHSEVQSKDKGKGILIEEPKPLEGKAHIEPDEAFARQLEAKLNANISWNAVMEQVKGSERLNDAMMKYQALNRKPLTEVQARKNMIIYLKNMAGFKMNYFNGLTYNEIRPLFEKHYNYNQAFLEEVNEEVTVPEKEVEVKAHKREGKSLEKEITTKQKMDEELVKERIEKTEPKNYSDDYLLKNLKIMFKQPNVEVSVWRDKKGRYGLAKRYPLKHFTLEQMMSNVRLEVKEESEVTLKLLRVVCGIQGGDEVVWLALELKGGDGGACGLLGDMGVKVVVRSWCYLRSMKWWLRVDSIRWILALKGVQRCRMVRGIQGGDELVWLALELKGGDGGTCGLLGDVGVKVVGGVMTKFEWSGGQGTWCDGQGVYSRDQGLLEVSMERKEINRKRCMVYEGVRLTRGDDELFLLDEKVCYEEINRGYVAFGGNPKGGRIIGKVLLSVPRKNNMYSVDLKNIVPKGGLTCLFSKAISDESKLWHRRLGHLNFKTMNSLVKENLVRGLPSKIFENNHTCVACQKGKQHKASCKSKTVSSISQPLQRVLVTKPHNKTPYELLLARSPSIGFMRPFRCPVTILNTLDPLGKFDGKADEGFLVGYSVNCKEFKGLDQKWLFDIVSLTMSINYQPVVAGNQPNNNSGIKENLDADPKNTDDDVADDAFEVKENENDVHVSANKSAKTDKNPNFRIAGKSSFVDLSKYTDDLDMPELDDIVYSDDEEDVGAEADLSNLETNIPVSPIPTTRVHKDHPINQIIDLPKSKRAIGSKWVFRNKKDERGIVIRNKARLIAHGHTQEEGINYDEVFAPVARIEDIRLFFSLCFFMGFMVYQMDVKSAFLYETIEKEVYMDDIIFGSTNKDPCTAFEKLIKDKFQMNVKSASTPIETEKPLLKDPDGEDVDVHIYRSMIGSLMYLTSSRPDIMFAVCAR
nr:hypothetical protein [Tanacetum cinerariifolium]